MSELIEKFFKADLTEAEEQALSDSLLASEEYAWEMGQAAEAAYLRYGYPPVKWPDSKNPPFGAKSGLKPWFGLGVLVILGAAAVWGWKNKEVIVPTLTTRLTSLSTYLGFSKTHDTGKNSFSLESDPAKKKEPRKVESKALSEKESLLISQPNQAAKKDAGGEGSKLSAGTTEATAQSLTTPFNLDENSSRKFSDIAVKINQAEAGFVSLRVLDMSGLEVTPLYAGNLASGHWVFEWDGKLKGGSPAKPGYYQVEVKSGSYTGRQNIRIH